MDPLAPVLESLDAIRRALDVGASLGQAVHGGVGPLASLLSTYLVTTVDPLSGGAFTLTPPLGQLTPLVQVACDSALGLALMLIFARVLTTPILDPRLRPARLFPRVLVGAVLVNYAPLFIQSAVDASNQVSRSLWALSLQSSWSGVLPALSYDPAAPYLSALVVLALFAGFLALGAALVVRFALLAVLVILSPLAALLLVVPETQHYARLWSNLFASALLMQPLQILVLGVGFGLDRSFDSPLGHLYALAALWLALKVPGAMRSGFRLAAGAR